MLWRCSLGLLICPHEAGHRLGERREAETQSLCRGTRRGHCAPCVRRKPSLKLCGMRPMATWAARWRRLRETPGRRLGCAPCCWAVAAWLGGAPRWDRACPNGPLTTALLGGSGAHWKRRPILRPVAGLHCGSSGGSAGNIPAHGKESLTLAACILLSLLPLWLGAPRRCC